MLGVFWNQYMMLLVWREAKPCDRSKAGLGSISVVFSIAGIDVKRAIKWRL